jgi:hypothetical protein
MDKIATLPDSSHIRSSSPAAVVVQSSGLVQDWVRVPPDMKVVLSTTK